MGGADILDSFAMTLTDFSIMAKSDLSPFVPATLSSHLPFRLLNSQLYCDLPLSLPPSAQYSAKTLCLSPLPPSQLLGYMTANLNCPVDELRSPGRRRRVAGAEDLPIGRGTIPWAGILDFYKAFIILIVTMITV